MKVTFRRTREIRRRILPFIMSLVMVLTINMIAYAADAPTITTQPASQTVDSGQTAGFSVGAEGTEALSYQWQKDGIDISGETSATLDIPNVRGVDSGSYTVVVTDAEGNSVTSDAATLTVIRTTLFQGVADPCGVAVDSSGNIYIADSGNNLIKKMDADGNNVVTLGSGFNYPCGVAVDSNGNIYVVDTNNNAVKKMDVDGSNIVTLGSGFSYPSGIAVDGSGNIYVADTNNNAVKKMDADGNNIVTLGSGFDSPCGIAVDGSGNIYVADADITVKKMDADGNNIVTLGSGFDSPCGVAVDGSGNIYVADTFNNAIKKMGVDGNNIVTLGSGFLYPCGVAVDDSGNIYVADSSNSAVKKMDAGGSNIVILDSGFNHPTGVAADSSGNIYVVNLYNNAVTKIDADGNNIVTLGSGFSYPSGVAVDDSGNIYVADSNNNAVKRMDAGGTNIVSLGSGFSHPSGIAVDSSGNIYIADADNNAVKKMDADGSNIEALGSVFNRPSGIAMDSSGNIYVADTNNSAVKKMDADGSNIVTLGSSFNHPYGVAVDSNGNICVADTINYTVKKMGADGNNIVTLGSDFSSPYGVAVDGSGNIYVADTFNNAIKKLQLLYGVAYNSNGSTGGSVPTDGSNYEQGDIVTVAGNTGGLARTGYLFVGWNTATDGGGTSYTTGSAFIMGAASVTLYAEWIPAYTVTYDANGGTGTAPTEDDKTEGATFPAAVNTYTAPSGKQFKEWNTAADGSGNSYMAEAQITMPAGNLNLYAIWENIPSGGGGSGGRSSTASTPTYKADVKAGNGSGTTLPMTVDKNSRSASIDIGSQNFTSGVTVITVPTIPDADTYSVGIPVTNLSTSDGQGMLTLNTDTGSITVSSDMLTGVSGVSGSKAQITIGQGDKNSLPDDVKAAIGDKPLVKLTLSIDDKQIDWSNPDAPVTVSIPYTPTAAELANPESIVIWYIDGSGNVVTIPNGRYDPDIGTVTFSTTHFSDYAVAYNPVNFNDVTAGAWYHDAVSFIAARGITDGTGNGKYSPDAKLTRGEFIVMLMKAYGIAPDMDLTDNFADAGNNYYTGYLAAAKRLGISGGVGNNMFAPGKQIIRQEMFTLLYNALKALDKLPSGTSGKALSDFTDASSVADWAEEAMTLLVKTGTVGGSNGKLAPISTTTRAEMAQVLYNLLGK